ncbi:MAG: membrane protein insertase YidC [Treponema sp.]|nr:membrane protein insertase YidC [Treponema sp.]
MITALYQIIIQPLILLTEFFYELIYEITRNEGLAVIGLSFVVTLFTLPLYMVAEEWQEKERKIQAKLKNGIERIKSTFKNDEQYMILNAYYRENHYHPIMALRSSFSLLIQIPFFMAAYNFLSHLEPLKEYSFLFIKNFGQPDATFQIAGLSINVLPIAMTIINCVAGAIYSKGHPLSEKIQIYVCALVFLLLLYDSPAGLVVYWTMNNILSLVKNIFYKIKNPRKVLYIIACIFAAICLVSSIFVLTDTKKIFRLALVLFAILIPIVPLVIKKLNSSISEREKNGELIFSAISDKTRLMLFVISAISTAVLAGLVIPTILIESEPEQYCFVDSYKSPFVFVFTAFCQAIGFFVFWPACFYALFSKKVKTAFSIIFPCIVVLGVINCFAFSGEYGPLTPELIFMQPQSLSVPFKQVLFNAAVMLATLAVILLLVSKKPKIMQSLCTILLISLAAISFKNSFSIQTAYSQMEEPVIKEEIEPVFHLSKTGKNVIVLMQDRLFLPFVPVYFEEHPEDLEKFDGFTLYNNCMSFCIYTMLGTPGIFGGYDYTPWEVNQRTDKTLQQKHNEAILSMPIVFHENGWNTTVADMPYENYLEQPVEKMYEGYPFVNRVTTHGTYSDLWYKQHDMKKAPFESTQIKRNFVLFSIFKMVSPVLRQVVYHNEYWLSWNEFDNTAKFIDNYSEIDYLPELTDFSSDKNAFLLLDNEATHEPMYLQAPDYVPVENITNYGNGKYADYDQYHTIAGVFKRLPDFFEYLKENDVYDNTRIIIVSDHGKGFYTGVFGNTDGVPILKDNYTATLMVKDFNQRGSLRTDNTFMTNADTPYLATKDLIEGAKNPFTNNLFEEKDKASRMKIASAPAESTRIRHNTKFTVADDHWYTVKDNIYVNENWGKYDMKKEEKK